MAIPGADTTDAELWQAYDAGASYDVSEDATLCKEFIVACRIILRRRPKSVSGDGQSADFESVREELKRAERWLATRGSTGAARGPHHLDFRNLRV